jgi:hypothetical protein
MFFKKHTSFSIFLLDFGPAPIVWYFLFFIIFYSTGIYLRKKDQLESLHDKNSDLNSNTSLLLNKHFLSKVI